MLSLNQYKANYGAQQRKYSCKIGATPLIHQILKIHRPNLIEKQGKFKGKTPWETGFFLRMNDE
jgi:hypothetical protein